MSKEIIYFADLTHTTQVIASEFMPFSVGCVAAYFMARSRHAERFEVEVFKFPEELSEAFAKRKPYALAMSNCLWNADLASQIARLAKKRHPDLITVFGGPNFSEVPEDQEEWLRLRPWVDFYVRLEGEVAFHNLIDTIVEHDGDVGSVKPLALNSVSSVKDDVFYSGETEERIRDFADIPSPYVTGLMDKYYETTLWPLVETNRGCPFSCAFCTEGMSYFNKVNKKSNDKIRDELTYIAKHHKKQKMIFMADSNFLMFKENLEVCDTIAGLQKKYDWPAFIGCTTGKNRQEIILEGAKRVNGTIPLLASVQHLDPDVLKNIKRNNISVDDLFNVARQGNKTGVTTYSETICSLPGDTLDKYKATLSGIIESGMNIIKTHALLLIEGTELYTPEARAKFGFQTRFRPNIQSFGHYRFVDEDFLAVECEEIVVATDTLSFEDYLECRRLQLTVHVFYNDDLFRELHGVLGAFGVPVWNWLMRVHEGSGQLNAGTKALYDSYMNDVEGELFDSPEQLRADFEHDPDQYLGGHKGCNVTFKHKALLFDKYVKDVLEIGYRTARELLREHGGETLEDHLDFLDDAKVVSYLRKGDIFNWSDATSHTIRFHPKNYVQKDFSPGDLERLDRPLTVRIEPSDKQKRILSHYFENHDRSNLLELTWLLNRVPASQLYREMVLPD